MAAVMGKYRDLAIARSWAAVAIVAVAVLFRAALLAAGVYPFNSDEAIVALMAKHTLMGEWPVFFYGQAYMGSLDASLVALGFKLFGEHIWVIRSIQLILYCAILLTSIRLSWKLTGSNLASFVTGLLLALPTVNLNLYTTVSLGGYGEGLLLGNFIMLLSLRIRERPGTTLLFFLWGVIAGLGFWAFGLTLIYSLPGLIFILLGKRSNRTIAGSSNNLLWITVGFLAGIVPILYWITQNGAGALLAELFGAALPGTTGKGYWVSVSSHFVNLIFFGITVSLGMRPPWGTRIFFWPLAVIAMLFWLAVLMQFVRALRGKSGSRPVAWLLGAMVLVLLLGFVLTPFGGDPSGRYFTPVTVILYIFAGLLFMKENEWLPKWLAWFLFAGVLAYQFSTNLQVALSSPTGFSTQFDEVARIDHGHDEALIHFLTEQGETRGFSNYWVSYPLAFKSNESLIFVPRLPYHLDFRYTSRDNRYAPYDSLVQKSETAAYITTHHPALDEKIRDQLKRLGVSWMEETIGDFQIFYNLSERVEPQEIDVRFK